MPGQPDRRWPRALSAVAETFDAKSIARRIYGLIMFAIVRQIGVAACQLIAYRNEIWAQRKRELTNLVDAALSAVKSECEAAQSGRLTVEEAQANAEQSPLRRSVSVDARSCGASQFFLRLAIEIWLHVEF